MEGIGGGVWVLKMAVSGKKWPFLKKKWPFLEKKWPFSPRFLLFWLFLDKKAEIKEKRKVAEIYVFLF